MFTKDQIVDCLQSISVSVICHTLPLLHPLFDVNKSQTSLRLSVALEETPSAELDLSEASATFPRICVLLRHSFVFLPVP